MSLTRLLLCLPLAAAAACSSHEERDTAAQYNYELLCHDLQMEYLYAETDEERAVAKDQIDRLECNQSVSSDEKRKRDSDHWRSMRDRGTVSTNGDIRVGPIDPRDR